MKRGPIALIASVAAEAGPFLESFRTVRSGSAPVPCYTARVNGIPILLLISGIGKTNAAHAAAYAILDRKASVIINFGVAGAYPGSSLNVGDIAVARIEVYADEGVQLRDGFHPLELIGIPLATAGRKKFFNAFPADKALSGLLLRAAKKFAPAARSGTFATVSTCSGTSSRAAELARRFGAICETMEGAAIAHLCTLHGIPFGEVRGISNLTEDRDLAGWNIPLAARRAQEALMAWLSVPVPYPGFLIYNESKGRK